MAVTGAIFKALTFNGESSRNYGVYITGSAVYNAPNRDVEMITIPGRNGSFPLDHGRFENIEVTYPAGVYADNEADFAEAISNFRNMLCSTKGYCRLEDEYNPDEYRMAIYKSGLEVEPAQLKAGEFDITFECMPQRYLTSGETQVTIGASTTLTNPTRFESSPELRVKGYGTVAFNGYEIDIPDAVYGDVTLINNAYKPYGWALPLDSDTYAINNDTIKVNANMPLLIKPRYGEDTIKSISVYSVATYGTAYYTLIDNRNAELGINNATFTFSKGTSSSKTTTVTFNVTLRRSGADTLFGVTMNYSIAYDATNDTISITVSGTVSPSSPVRISFVMSGLRPTVSASVYGSKSVLGDPTIIDCESGEVYKEVTGGVVSLNAYINLGAELPKLATGSAAVTTAGSITECKLLPRWWKV